MSLVNSQINDSVNDATRHILGNAPAGSFGLLDMVGAETLGMLMHNSVSAQHNGQVTSNAAVTATCARLIATPRVEKKTTTDKEDSGDDDSNGTDPSSDDTPDNGGGGNSEPSPSEEMAVLNKLGTLVSAVENLSKNAPAATPQPGNDNAHHREAAPPAQPSAEIVPDAETPQAAVFNPNDHSAQRQETPETRTEHLQAEVVNPDPVMQSASDDLEQNRRLLPEGLQNVFANMINRFQPSSNT